MAKKDLSRVSVERAAVVARAVQRRLRDTIPYGPSKVRMEPAELRLALQRGGPDMLQRIMTYLGPEQALALLLGARPKRAPELDEFLGEHNANT